MPFYSDLRQQPDDVRERTAAGLLRLKDGLQACVVPERSLDDRLLVATWNIREFDNDKCGIRGLEPLLYIAEVISAFDLVAIQEVQADLGPLDRLMALLGPWWQRIVTDVTRGTSGNFERLAFLYDSRKVRFSGLAGEVVLPDRQRDAHVEFVRQFARTPFLVGFSVGWFKFTICTAHIYYGTDSADDPRRLEEIKALAGFLADAPEEVHPWSRNVLMLGDFNVFDTSDATLGAIEERGFVIPDGIKAVHTDLGQTHHYDQIAFRTPDVADQLAAVRAGSFGWDEFVYRVDDAAVYEPQRAATGGQLTYRTWRTFQMSDHLPLWVELKTDFSRPYLTRLGTAGPAPAPVDR